MVSLFQLIALLLTLTAAFAWLNATLLRLPSNVGLLLMGLVASLVLLAIEIVAPGTKLFDHLVQTLRQIDFYDAVMNGMLGFLLFAGALHVDFDAMRSRASVIGLLAILGTLLATVIIGGGFYLVSRLLGLPVSVGWALVFGALIAPTDPVAVLATLKTVNVPSSLQTDLPGESLFNDGIAVVLFSIALQIATSGGGGGPSPAEAVLLLLFEGVGGGVLGLVTGFVAYFAMRRIDDYSVEVLISLALVTGTYAGAEVIGVSGPIAVVVAGLLIGSRGADRAMSDLTRRYLFGFWSLIDDMLNAVLFLLIGLEVLVMRFEPSLWPAGLLAVLLVLLGRFLSVAISIAVMRRWCRFARGSILVLTWGGVRGGISVALVLSLPSMDARPTLLVATYSVVLFSVVVQGLSLPRLVRYATATPLEGDGG